MGKERPLPGNVEETDLFNRNRRQLMKYLGSLGLGAATAATLTADDVRAASSGEVPITYAMHRDDEAGQYIPQKKSVDAAWLNSVTVAHRVHDRRDFQSRPGVVGTTVRPGSQDGGETEVTVEIAPEAAHREGGSIDTVRKNLPTEVDGIPVRAIEAKEPELANCYDDDPYGVNPPAGVKCGDDDGNWGSLGSPMWNPDNGEFYFCTNYHVFNDPQNDQMHQEGSTAIGDVVDYDCYDDFVVCEGINGYYPSTKIVDNDVWTIGWYSASGIDDLASRDEIVTKNGVRTCQTAGKVKGRGHVWVAEDTSCNARYDQVKWGNDTDMGNGDSGSTTWNYLGDGDAYVLNLNAGWTYTVDMNSYVYGTGAYELFNMHGWGF